ncbi:hypothetical protein Pan258_02210 [Symmachiella dynata]|uniref:hypothetical protein n=1 Tax=Symmachiella dynata TaxID=2527995 RepID=UPI00118AD7A2|nr:hypothetical protein [Symmachiella dynata]QDT46204.1 hypothetical protein Pan258_02210 [Symmachiella dynata]
MTYQEEYDRQFTDVQKNSCESCGKKYIAGEEGDDFNCNEHKGKPLASTKRGPEWPSPDFIRQMEHA